MLDKKDTTLLKLDCKNKDKVYDMLFGKADACLKNAKTVALLYLGSPYYMTRALEEYNIEEVNIFTTKDFKFIYEPFENAERAKIWYVDNVKDTFKECDMKFDCIIMNPPYQRNLHLKILAEAIKHLKDEKSVCVNLSPISTYQKCVKLEKEFPVAVTDIDVISQENMNNCFDIGLWVDGGIVTVGKNATKDFSKFTYLVKHLALYKKLQKHSAKLKDQFTNSPADFSLRFFVGCNCDISHKFTMTPKTYADACTKKLNGHIAFINCTSDIERHNLYDVACGRFMKFCCYIDLDVRPWLGDSINPRTGLKGYTGEWTDDDLVLYFGITPEEKKVIEETMEKYK